MYKILNNILEMDDYSLQRLSKSSKLPSEYHQVGYIESTGTQYIDTGVIPISSTRIDIDFAYVGTTSSFGWVPIFGSRSIVNNVQEQYAVFINNSNLKLTTNYSTRDFGDNSNVYIEANKKYNLKNNQGSFYINDILESSISTSDTLSNTRYPVYLFDLCQYGGRLNRGTRMKLYSCKFYDGDTLIRNYIPCYRKSDNEIGLYDIVNNVFYTNQGTGEFTYGSISLALSTPVGVKGVGDRTNDLSFIDFNNWESEQYDINENKDIEETEQIKSPNILSDTYTSITADTEVQPSQVDFIPKAIDEIKTASSTVDDVLGTRNE